MYISVPIQTIEFGLYLKRTETNTEKPVVFSNRCEKERLATHLYGRRGLNRMFSFLFLQEFDDYDG